MYRGFCLKYYLASRMLLYYLLIRPLSLLPLRVLYGVSYAFYLLLLFPIAYRKTVIENNLRKAFPDLAKDEIRVLRNKAYHHLSLLLAEGIKNLGISKKELQR